MIETLLNKILYKPHSFLQNGITVIQPGPGNSSPEVEIVTSPPTSPPVIPTVAPSINGEPYMYYASLPRCSPTNQQYVHYSSRTLPRNINHLIPRYHREHTYLMQPSALHRCDHTVTPTFGIIGLGGVWQQYSDRDTASSILTSLSTSYAVTTSDSDEDLE